MINTTFSRVGAVVTEMRKLHPTMTLQTFTLFLEVARKPGVEAVELNRSRASLNRPSVAVSMI